MNILVKTHSGKIIVRPDTTWERDNEDVFLPEFVNSVSFTPVLFARICKPGRSVEKKFADRYYDGINYGILLYPDDLMDKSEEGFASASCLDHTSFLPTPLFHKLTLGRENNEFKINKNGYLVYSYNSGTAAIVEETIEEATRYCYIRTGDLLAIELDGLKPLCAREEGKAAVSGSYCGNQTLEFNIIL